MIRGALFIGLAVLSQALIFVGTWYMYPPAAPVAVGALLWIDLTLMGRGQAR